MDGQPDGGPTTRNAYDRTNLSYSFEARWARHVYVFRILEDFQWPPFEAAFTYSLPLAAAVVNPHWADGMREEATNGAGITTGLVDLAGERCRKAASEV